MGVYMKDFYKILGVPRDADAKEIKKAYRGLSMKYHPDHNDALDAGEKMAEINEAYEVLGDATQRSDYDNKTNANNPAQNARSRHEDIIRQQHEAMRRHQANIHGNPFANNPFFQSVFSGQMGNTRVFHNGQEVFSNGRQVPETISHTMEISMFQCYHGCTIGFGYMRWQVINNEKINEKQSAQISISPGIRCGEKITLKGAGNMLADDNRGDVVITVMIADDPMFKRIGDDLHTVQEIPLRAALTNFTLQLKHPSGKMYAIRNNVKETNTIITPGYRKVLPGMGLKRQNTTGCMVVEFKIKFPKELTDEQVDAMTKHIPLE